MKRKILAVALTLALLVSVLSVGTVLNTSAAAAVVTGGTVAEVTAEPTATNLLAGLTPTQGIGTAPVIAGNKTKLQTLTDGCLPGVSAAGTDKTDVIGTADSWMQITYSLDTSHAISQVLVCNSKESENLRARWGRIYVSTTLETLYSDANKVLDFSDVNLQAAMFTLTNAKQGKYIGFSLYILPGNSSYGNWWNQLRLGELGVYGGGVSAPVKTGGTVTEITAVPAESNRIAGQTATQGTTASTVFLGNKTDVSAMVDGNLPGVSDTDTGKTAVMAENRANDSWTQITYDLKETYRLNSFLVCNSIENGANYRARWGKIYISDKLSTLYDGASLVLEYADVNLQAMLFTLDAEKEGRYVGFSFYIIPDNGIYNGINYGKWWNQVRIGELGVYGTVAPSTDNCGWTMQALNNADDAAKLPQDTSLTAGLIPTANDSVIQADSAHPITQMTDGIITGITTDEENKATAVADTFMFVLDKEYTIDRFLLAGSAKDEDSDAFRNRTLAKVEIYVCNSANWDYVLPDSALQVRYTNRAKDLGMLFTLDTPVTGQYIVVKVPRAQYSRVRISEFAAYAASVQLVSNKQQATMLPTGTNLLCGIRPTLANADAFSAWNISHSLDSSYTQATDGFVNGLTASVSAIKMTMIQDVASGDPLAQITYDLGKVTAITELLIAPDATDDKVNRLNAYKIFMSDDAATLFDDAHCIINNDDHGEHLALIYRMNTQARYVGLTIAEGQYMQLRVGEFGVYNNETETVSGSAGQLATEAVFATALPKSPNLLEGLTPVNSGSLTVSGGNWADVTDGYIPDVSVGGDDAQKITVAAAADSWTQITYDLGGAFDLNKILIANSVETNAFYRLRWGKVYVSDTPEDLYTEEHLTASFADVNKQAFTIALNGASGRYVGFSFYALPQNGAYNGRTYARWDGLLRLAELGVYGTVQTGSVQNTVQQLDAAEDAAKIPAENNLLVSAQMSALFPNTFDAADPYSNLTDGVIYGINEATTKAKTTFTNSPLIFTLERQSAIRQILVANSAQDSTNQWAPRYQVFISDTAETLFSAENLVTDYIASDDGYHTAQLITLGRSVSGSVVGIRFTDGIYQRIRLTELAVYGTPNANAVTLSMLGSEADASLLPTGNNLLKDLNVLTADGGAMAMDSAASFGTDGIILGITAPQPDGKNPAEDNKMSYYTNTNASVVYDLKGTVQISQFLLATGVWDNASMRMSTAKVYVGDSLEELFEGSPVAEITFGDSIAAVMTVSGTLTGRYVGFSIPTDASKYNIVRIGEIGVYGTYTTPKLDGLNNLIANKEPADAYICEVGRPDRYNDEKSYLNGVTFSDLSAFLTDGSYETRCAYVHQSLDRLPKNADRNYICTITPWSVLVFHLGGEAEVNEILLTSTGEWGNYFVGGADFYVGENLASLFQDGNRVYTSHGEKIKDDEDGEAVLDEDYDVQTRCIRCSLDTPRTGRYMAVVITRPTSSTKLGYSIARMDELEVFGTKLSDEVFPETSFKDNTYGCTMEITPHNYDDDAFFRTLDHLEVTRAEYTADKNSTVCNNWLRVDPDDYYRYIFTMYDVNGQAVTQQQIDGRKFSVTIPNTTGHMEGLGYLDENSIVNRIRNSRTLNGQVLADPETDSTTFVKLIFDDSRVIYNGVAGWDAQTAVAGASDVAVEAADPVDLRMYAEWLWALPVLAGAAVVAVAARRRKRTKTSAQQ